MAKNLVNKQKLELILKLWKSNQITLDDVTLLLQDTFETTAYGYYPYMQDGITYYKSPFEITSGFTTTLIEQIKTEENGKDETQT